METNIGSSRMLSVSCHIWDFSEVSQIVSFVVKHNVLNKNEVVLLYVSLTRIKDK